jgi:hypothetical protein
MSLDIKEYIEENLDLLPSDKVLSQVEAQKRASKFLAVVATLASAKHDLSNDKIKLQSLFSIANNEALSSAQGATVGARTAAAEASAPYIEAREGVEEVENNIKYIHTMMEVFTNAHILLRGMSKETMG